MILRDSHGWPVELVIGRPALNVFRRVLVTNWRVTWARRRDGWPQAEPDQNVACSYPLNGFGPHSPNDSPPAKFSEPK